MLAMIQKMERGYRARFERRLPHAVDQVWAWLTENEKLAQWFSELRIEELREGGKIKFDMQNGTFEEMEIIELKLRSILEYTWDKDLVRFELYPEAGGCRLVLIEKIHAMTDHTPRDLAGWHVCLDVIHALMEGRTVESRKDDWEKWYVQYVQLVREVN
ncbi:SRPBCC family protein [Paenibacillus agricola]|uniref:SRPBCC family protein n=1 Tax=Paenibacillus agricola TaxID=2716264 RepID=A0ABX0J916_9BACL|nr:SRPBCC family protein [Paenibacillus agricola]NHN31684.1 SRPBCC family protein [Paenibacillus agricola]